MSCVLLYACSYINNTLLGGDDELFIERKPYLGNELKIDGYYYQESEDLIYARYFFYKNGILLQGGGGGSSIEQIIEKDEMIKNGTYYNTVKNSKLSWGVFEIEGTTIRFEHWYPSSGGPLKAYVRAGTIINDTTFRITQSYRMQSGTKTEMNSKDELYYFKELSPKPDSTNVFVP